MLQQHFSLCCCGAVQPVHHRESRLLAYYVAQMVGGQGKQTGIERDAAMGGSILPKQREEPTHDFFAAGETSMRAFGYERPLQLVDIGHHRENEETDGTVGMLRSPHLSGYQVEIFTDTLIVIFV